MTLKALSHDVRSILCASAQINNYKTAIAELVYNALDAESTSIAIRVNIQENRLQVLDNGCGIMKNDFEALGKRYMTSKVTNIATLQAMPKYYGFRGEFLTNLIEISQRVNIMSRYKDGEETWAQTFYENKKKCLLKMTTRPSKGTTVDVTGFLYNLKIQKRAIDPLNDLQNIKEFLEQLSIIQDNISLSLRDDSKNEIIFKIHKKRNIYQTLSTLFDINQSDVQELQIQKNQYKIKAYIGKTDKTVEKYWIYINGKLVQTFSKLHKITNEYLRKYLRLTDIKKIKYRNNYDEEHLSKSNIPFYFILITCPYNDYDISFTLRQSLVEFKNWGQIKTILEKLIRFYVGDINLKEIKRREQKVILQNTNNKHNGDTRYQIEKIVDKILGSNSKKIRVSQLQNGIKGRLIKRKKRVKNKELNRGKSFPKLDKITHPYDDLNAAREMNSKNKNEKHLVRGQDSTSITKHRISIPMDKCIKENLKDNKIEINNSMIKNNAKLSKIKNTKKKHQNKNKISKPKNNNRQTEVFQFLEETDTIPKRSKIVAQKVREFLNDHCNYSNIEKDVTNKAKSYAFTSNKHHANWTRCKVLPDLASGLNKHAIDNNGVHKIKPNPFKTTYDLVKTIIESQQLQDKRKYSQADNSFAISVRDHPIVNHKHILLNHQFSQFYNSYRQEPMYDKIQNKMEPSKLTYDSTYSINIDRQYSIRNNYYNTSVDLTSYSLRCKDIFKEDFLGHCTQNDPSYLSNIQTVSALTYQSHNYNNNYLNIYDENAQTYIVINQHKNCSVSKAKSTRFITNQSKDNFIPSSNKYLPKNCVTNKYHGSLAKQAQFYSKHVKQMKDKSYTNEFTTSNKINCSFNKERIPKINQSKFLRSNVGNNKHSIRNSYSLSYEPPTDLGNTYTIHTCSRSSDHNLSQCGAKSTTPNEVLVTNSVHYSNININNNITVMQIENNENKENQDNYETIIFSNPEYINNEVYINEDIQPMNFCETVFQENESIEKEFAYSFNIKNKSNDSLYNNLDKNNSSNENNPKYIAQTITLRNINENVSHHFKNKSNTNLINAMDDISNQSPAPMGTKLEEINNMYGQKSQHPKECNTDYDKDVDGFLSRINDNNFDFKGRLRFLPKGMSQIFEKNGSKTICDYNLDKDYYEDVIYNDFANDIEMQTEIYEPAVQNVEDLATKDIQKLKIKVDKDNTSLFFDEKSLKEARILNQVDCKFIATIIKGRSRGLETVSDYLILFDQHAVHERIRLENNLADYFTEDKWKRVPLDNITLKMSKDDMVYLHNYKDKFNQLGLQWSILDKDEVSISSIPEAILGKNLREVEKVIKAVKNLIMEEINVIKLQKGCISLYPKSIMDLVFSEACRYAIKFGDKLSKSDCVDLLHELSNCKTPFQCAHGRPVMAVLLEIKSAKHDYNINIDSLKLFKLNKKKHSK